VAAERVLLHTFAWWSSLSCPPDMQDAMLDARSVAIAPAERAIRLMLGVPARHAVDHFAPRRPGRGGRGVPDRRGFVPPAGRAVAVHRRP
jgi:hypothetical protein